MFYSSCDTPGNFVLRSPIVTNPKYVSNAQVTKETFGIGGGGWMKTGDKAMIRKVVGLRGGAWEHLFIVNRIMELIQIKVQKI